MTKYGVYLLYIMAFSYLSVDTKETMEKAKNKFLDVLKRDASNKSQKIRVQLRKLTRGEIILRSTIGIMRYAHREYKKCKKYCRKIEHWFKPKYRNLCKKTCHKKLLMMLEPKYYYGTKLLESR